MGGEVRTERSVPPSLSVVIPAHNVAYVLAHQLEALCAQEYAAPWDVVVVDNRSSDATAAVASRFTGRLDLHVVDAPDGATAAYARNVGIGASTGDLLVFLDADDLAAPGLLAAYGEAAACFDVMGGDLDDLTLNDPVVAAWRYPLTDGALPVALGRFPFFVGANCAVKRRVFEQLGLFDETLEFVGEEVDFSVRAGLAGLCVGWVPNAVVHYRHRPSLRALVRQQYVYGRGAVVLFERYRDVAASERRSLSAIRRLAEIVLGVPNLLRGRVRRGQWLRLAAFMAGRYVESARRRVWYVG